MSGGGDAVLVLVVDDAPDVAEVIAEFLAMKGYEVQTALDGAQAMASVALRKPHCVILDIRMPNINGLEFAQQLRATQGDDIVLIAMSGYPATEPSVKAAFAIVDHYLQKPFELEALDKILPDLR